jgi:hypothetical protein
MGSLNNTLTNYLLSLLSHIGTISLGLLPMALDSIILSSNRGGFAVSINIKAWPSPSSLVKQP